MKTRFFVLFTSLVLMAPHAGYAQTATPPITLRGVPVGDVSTTPLPLSLAEAIRRGLAQNLATILEEQRLRGTESTRLLALSALLPHVSGSVRQSTQVISTAAFGFDFPGVPSIIGPFGVFDARLSVSTPIFDARAINGVRAGRALVRAGQAELHDVRDTVVLAVGALYLQVEADASRVDAARAQVATADALARLADDQRAAGLVAGIDVLRQQVQVQAARARLITVQNDFAKRKLSLARAIGLPAGQMFTPTDSTRFLPAPAMSVDEAVAQAIAEREDLRAAQARVEAARAVRQAESASALPSVHLDADVGALGKRASEVDRTYSVAGVVKVPIFEGGARAARLKQADVDLREREAELADLSGGLRYEIQAALLDVQAAAASVEVADSARRLSAQELEQAQDRFRAGVASTLELVQAQESVADAADQYIASVYGHTVAKARLARELGHVEQKFVALVGGQQ